MEDTERNTPDLRLADGMTLEEEEAVFRHHVQDIFAANAQIFSVKFARMLNEPGSELKEVVAVWQCPNRTEENSTVKTRGFLTRHKKWRELPDEWEYRMKYDTFVYSPDCTLAAYMSESIDDAMERDVIQIYSVVQNKAILSIVLEPDDFHAEIITYGINSHFKFSPNNKKLMYFAAPKASQSASGIGSRAALMCVFDFETEKTTVFDDEELCSLDFNLVEWTPDSNGVVFHRDYEILWYTFGDSTLRLIVGQCPEPMRMTFSPDNKTLAIFNRSFEALLDSSILMFQWPPRRENQKLHTRFSFRNDCRMWSVPDRPWANLGKQLVFNVQRHAEIKMCILNVEENSMTYVKSSRPGYVLDVHGEDMLFETMASNQPSRLWLSPIAASENSEMTCSATFLNSRKTENPRIHEFNVDVLFFDEGAYSGVLLSPVEEKGRKRPLVVVPHCWKQAAFTVMDRNPTFNTLVTSGFYVLIVNPCQFNETQGCTELELGPFPTSYENVDYEEIETLLEDIHGAVLETLEKYSHINNTRVYLYGDSFGAFLAAALALKEPQTYARLVLSRPILHFPEDVESIERTKVLEARAKIQAYEPKTNVKKFRIPIFVIMERNNSECWPKYKDFVSELPKGYNHVVKTPPCLLSDGFVKDVVTFFDGFKYGEPLNKINGKQYLARSGSPPPSANKENQKK